MGDDQITLDQDSPFSAEDALFKQSSETAPTSVTLPYRANLLGNIEQALKGLQGYAIMALELIQNADDAGAKRVSFDAQDHGLIVGNEGSFTSCGLEHAECPWIKSGGPSGLKRPCNFHAIAEMGSRSKLHATDQIGRFGIGFVSVYQITDTPIIQSSGVELRLNPQTQEVVKSEIPHSDGTQFILPWAENQSDVREGLNASPTPPDVADKVVKEIEHVLQGSLLFLRHVDRVELRRNGKLVVDVRIDRFAEEVTLRFQPADITQKWLVLSRKADDVVASARLLERFEALARLNRSTTVSVAVPLNDVQLDGLLYAYLPTRQSIRIPVHVNGDFFPHASRQAIVLEGEQHERYWNETLIETAAAALADNFVRIRELLGPTRFWGLLDAAFQRKSEPAFKAFWDRLGKVASESPSIWTTQGKWCLAKETALPPDAMTAVDQIEITNLGLALIHSELRRYWTVLSSIGAQQLKLLNVVTALEAVGDKAIGGGGQSLRKLWSAIELLIEQSSDKARLPAVFAKLKAVPFMLDTDGRAISANDARRLPAEVSTFELRRVLPSRRVVIEHVLKFPHLSSLVKEYLLDDFVFDLANLITDEESAAAIIGKSEADARRFYTLLTSFPTDRKTGVVANTLADVPILRTRTGFVSPSRGQLPGDFRDPIGHFQIVDAGLFVPGMMDLARSVLKVNVLTFRRYVEEHLEEILGSELSLPQYQALLTEIVNHRAQLDEDGTLGALADIAFVRNRAEEFVRPGEAYFWSASLEAILGDEPARWVDEAWLPGEIARVRDLFDRLGTPSTVAADHIVERIGAIAESDDLNTIAAGTTPIIRHVLNRWTRFDEEDRTALSGLREVHFLTAIVDGKRDEESIYAPTEVYRAGRAAGFASQVPIVEMTALRQSISAVNEFLDLIGMPPEPPTEDIVAHLEHCMSSGTSVNDLTYQMLSERLERSDDDECIGRLKGTKFINVPETGFIGAGDVFWIPPVFGGYWHTASQRMRQREPLYRRLGVIDSPEPRHFAALTVQIASTASLSSTDVLIHGRCLATLAEALEQEAAGAAEAVDLLKDEDAFLNIDGLAIWTGHAVWLDSEQLAAAFGSVLNARLVRLTDVSHSASSRFLKRLNVPALTDIARFCLAEDPDGTAAKEATSMLRERADLILWLAPNRTTRRALEDILLGVEIRFSDRLLVQAEIDAFDPPVRSPASPTPAYFDREAGLLHIRPAKGRVEWVAVFRVLFAEVDHFCPSTNIPPLCLTAAYIMSLPDKGEAEQALLASNFKAPAYDDQEIEGGRELKDEPGTQDIEISEGLSDTNLTNESPVTDQELSSVAGTPDARLGREVAPNEIGDGLAIEGTCVSEGDDSATYDDDDDAEIGTADEVDNEAYRSAPSRVLFGEDTALAVTPDGTETISGGQVGTGSVRTGRVGTSSQQESNSGVIAVHQMRRSRMLSYVSRSGTRGDGDTSSASAGDDITDLIDAAAMKAASVYEEARGWKPERQHHFNPGFDIVSKSPSGSRRLIEVKGLENEWTERGIKLSHVQFSMAREHPDDFWIYVVEHARDLERQRITAIANPFGKVEEYWFDHAWREMSEERSAAREIHLKVGLKVEHHIWREGTVVEIKSRGSIPFVVVDFGPVEGRRGIPFNSFLKILD